MTKTQMKWIVGGAVGAILLLILLGTWISASNREIRLRNLIEAKQRDNTSEFDNMWKKIAQSAEVTTEAKNALMDLFQGHAQARGGTKGSLATWVQESIPDAAPTSQVYRDLMNTITASRDAWTRRQKELLDLKREHDDLVMTFPSSLFVGGRGRIEVKIITSSKTERTFETGMDDDVDLFRKD